MRTMGDGQLPTVALQLASRPVNVGDAGRHTEAEADDALIMQMAECAAPAASR